MGFEPVAAFDATANGSCACELCQEYLAAIALHSACSNCLAVASFDVDLQCVVASWVTLPEAIRMAVMTLVGEVVAPSKVP